MIKVLFLSEGKKADYMCDMVYHGLKTNPNVLVEEFNVHHYMYRGYPRKASLYGIGFTIACRLKQSPNSISLFQLLSRIKRKYYDLVVYGSVWRYNHFFSYVRWSYPAEKIIGIDGEDHTRIHPAFQGKSSYFKRELESSIEGVSPINFCIPEDLIVQQIPPKTRKVATIVPGKLETYIYKDEEPYYRDYQDSLFGITMKKAGWDCLRHYEILMNGCIPYFVDLNACPYLTMLQFPKGIIKQTNALYESCATFNGSNYINDLLEHTRTKLTTTAIVNDLLRLA
jgi:hypothetical protein